MAGVLIPATLLASDGPAPVGAFSKSQNVWKSRDPAASNTQSIQTEPRKLQWRAHRSVARSTSGVVSVEYKAQAADDGVKLISADPFKDPFGDKVAQNDRFGDLSDPLGGTQSSPPSGTLQPPTESTPDGQFELPPPSISPGQPDTLPTPSGVPLTPPVDLPGDQPPTHVPPPNTSETVPAEDSSYDAGKVLSKEIDCSAQKYKLPPIGKVNINTTPTRPDHIWTLKNGDKINAALLYVEGDTLTLQKVPDDEEDREFRGLEPRGRGRTGEIVKIPLDDLSEADRNYAETQRADVRTWTYRTGKYEMKAQLLGIDMQKVQLRTSEGQTVSVLLDDLSLADQHYVLAAWNLPRTCPLPRTKDDSRLAGGWGPITYTWKASALCHKPLYFEDVQLERYGHSRGPFVQPVWSAAHFFLNVPILPYRMGINPPTECVYSLGYYRPGSCAPYMLEPFPISLRGAAYEAAFVTGLVYVLP